MFEKQPPVVKLLKILVWILVALVIVRYLDILIFGRLDTLQDVFYLTLQHAIIAAAALVGGFIPLRYYRSHSAYAGMVKASSYLVTIGYGILTLVYAIEVILSLPCANSCNSYGFFLLFFGYPPFIILYGIGLILILFNLCFTKFRARRD